jgi:hypothetical protein
MTSSSDDASNIIAMLQQQQPATPIPGLPVAGKDSSVGDPYEYGKFQSFLPEPKSSGPNDMATGLRPEMLQYRSPNGGGSDQLRNQLAATITSTPNAPAAGPAAATPQPSGGGYTPKYLPNGQLDPSDPGNIARYYELMGSSGGSPAAPTFMPTS